MEIKNYHLVKSLKEAHEWIINEPKSVILGGGAWLKFMDRDIEHALDLKNLYMDQIKDDLEEIVIGSMTTLHQVETHYSIQSLYDGIVSKALSHILGVSFRNIATIGGSIVGRYGFSDVITPLLALDAKLMFYPPRTVDLKDFLLERGKVKEVLVAIRIPKQNGLGYYKKVSNTPLDFAILNLALTKHENKYNISIGGRPSVATRLEKTEKILNEATSLDDMLFNTVIESMNQDISFGDNQQASASYRQALAETYLIRAIKAVNAI
jgi:CO/xanthine dehydrogenase FAD-binding subunit